MLLSLLIPTIAAHAAPSASIAVSPSAVNEDGAANLVYTVTLSEVPMSTVSVAYSVGGSATSGVDYAAISSPLVFASGQTVATIAVNPTLDGTVEADETVVLTLEAGAGYSVGSPSSASGTILNDEVPGASIAVSPASVSEDGATNLVYTVTLSHAPMSAVSVAYSVGGSATSGVDYAAVSSPLVITAGQTSGTITINPTADGTVEADETVVLTLAAGSGYSVGSPSSAIGTILNEDVPSASIAVSPASVSEDGTTNLVYAVTLSQAPMSAVSVAYSVGGSATSGIDYAAVSSPLVITAGQTSGTITINPTADGTVEADETVVLTLAAGSGYSVGSPSSASGTILNEDQPTLSINDVALGEGDAGTSTATFTVSLSQPAGAGGVSFDIATAGGTATAGADYGTSSLSGQTIPAGSSSATFSVVIHGDTLSEASETFFVNVSNVTGATVADAQGQGTIVNDDAQPALSIGDVSVSEGNSGTSTATFTVSLSAASGQTVSVNYATTDGTATAGSDYVAVSGTLTFPPGVTTQSVAVTISGDTVVEANETFSLSLSGTSNATIAVATGTGTIANDDVAVTIGPASLPAATTGTAYSQTLSAGGGTAPYTFAVTAGGLPSGVTLSAAGVLSGTPTASGSFSFTATATDSAGSPASGSRAYTLTVALAPVSFVFTPAAGPLPEAMVGEGYSQAISASGGSGTTLYSLAAGALPDGLVLNVSTGALTGPLAATAAVGDYSFTLQVTDGNGATGTAAYTLKVNARAVTVADQTISVPAGAAPLNVDLTQGATGGPFTAGDLVSVSPANAGTVSIVNGEFAQVGPVGSLGWYLKFIPNPAYKGQVTVSFRLTSALGVSNLGVIIYNVAYDPGEVAANFDTLVHGFVETRQTLIASTIAVPGLLERRQMATAQSAFSGRVTPGEDGATATFATSLAQMEAARARADGVEAAPSPFNAWMSGTVMLHDRDDNDGWGSFAMLSAGADYLLSDRALIGLSLHYDHMVDPTDEDAQLTGNGWLAGPYGSFEVADGIYWDTSLLYGGSSNTIDTAFWGGAFDTTRWLFDSAIKGELTLGNGARLTPKLRAIYLTETVRDYAVDNDDGDLLELGGFTTDQLRVSVGAEYARDFRLDDGASLTPRLGVTAGFAGLDGSGAFGSLTAGLTYAPSDVWTLDLGLLLGVEGDGQTSTGAKLGLSGRF